MNVPSLSCTNIGAPPGALIMALRLGSLMFIGTLLAFECPIIAVLRKLMLPKLSARLSTAALICSGCTLEACIWEYICAG